MILAVRNLTLACYLTDNVAYGEAALKFIDAWFLSSSSGMIAELGLEYSQLVPGLKTGRSGPSDLGRSFGVIDGKDLGYVLDGLSLIQGVGVPRAARALADLKQWFARYYPWLSGSVHAKVEFN